MLKKKVYRGYLGPDRTIQFLQERYFWPEIEGEIRYFFINTCPCVHQKKQASNLSNITISPIFTSRDHANRFSASKKSSGGFEYMLLDKDHFTSYTVAYPTKSNTTKKLNRLYTNFILRFGIPSKILDDQGGEFENGLLRPLESLLEIN